MLPKIIFLLFYCLAIVESFRFQATNKIYLDIRHGSQNLGRMVIGLFGNDAPKTVQNFRHICLKGINGRTYKGTRFHRVIQRFMIQGGDIVNYDGTGSVSIFGKYFEDENLTISHTRAGFIGMANRGPDTNGCQFYITTTRTEWLDGKHTIFGKVYEGMEVLFAIEKVKTNSDDEPLVNVTIHKCGEIKIKEPFQVSDELYTLWDWMVAIGPPCAMSFIVLAIFHYLFRKLSMVC
ncbi:peptidyl-prolyl cis-trans isomerase, rhodopsin-specific isozyme [Condylostylus longicornis]|uniref:peptidyl-prolyl cis-trans isomerase, rhodopsin-specific isozyme n=1 Tax=Condylostylus longicornis TaxID=2530218 RepID=UPI00244DE1CF|nr:peptidyl-prolyl cis-trans isomerase, rhodopsin-specific isozyme [Condylostylus longicornis]